MHQFTQSIFREYDIRGRYGETLTNEDAYFIGRAYATMLPQDAKICVGYDGRNSSPSLSVSLIKGLTESGVNVVNVGLGPTPMVYFGAFHLDADGAIMVTASHNPPADNGFKFMLGKDAMFGEQIMQVSKVTEFVDGEGFEEKLDINEAYIERLLQDADISDNVKVLWDPANGAMADINKAIVQKIPGEHNIINGQIDGNFPAHPADPTKLENNKQLIALIPEYGADIGIGFDGDGDRVGIIDEKGRMFYGDQILSILARDVLASHPGAPIIADIKTSKLFEQEISRLGGNPILWKTGHSLIKSKMKEMNSPLAGEMSAHIFFADKYYGFDDGMYAAIRFLNIMNSTGMKASELLDALPVMHSSPEYRLKVPEERKFALIEEIKAEMQAQNADFSDIDGVRVNTENGWWLMRASNTAAEIVVRYEADTAEGLESLNAEMKEYLAKYGINLTSF